VDLWHNGGVITSSLPTLSVTVTLFTVASEADIGQAPTLRTLISLGTTGEESVGTGLFCVTRKSNDQQTGQAPSSGKRVLPASVIYRHERVTDAARRIITDELGLTEFGRVRHSRIFDDPSRGDIEGAGRVISLSYWAIVPFDALAPVLGGRDQVGLELVSSSSLLDYWGPRLAQSDGVSRFGLRESPHGPSGHQKRLTTELYGETILDADHDEMVFYSWRLLRYAFAGKLDPFRYLGTRVLGDKFRLSDLRELSDVCRGERVQPDHFRRTLTSEDSFVQEVGEVDRTRPGKPASLYTLKKWAEPTTDTTE
jgi:ADP-ribose pyrophosphatase YjhB (NUDIX family)